MSLPTVEAALSAMLAQVSPLATDAVPVAEADGRWLIQAVTATRDQPPFDASAMDGWAVRAADLDGGARLTVVGESAAGRGFDGVLQPRETVRISTGAPLPPGSDRVVMQEDADRRGDRLTIAGDLSASTHVRPRGCDFHKGDALLSPGQRLNPWRLALAASAGAGVLACGARPRVAILATGDELVEPGQTAGPDQIYNSGAPSLGAFVTRHGGKPSRLAVAADREAAILEGIADAAFDLLVTVGGASVGDHDRVKPALRSQGAILYVEGVAMRPGKPVWFAILADGRPVLGLPGNPASALVCAELFLAPLLAHLQGGEAEDRFETAILAADLPANGPRDHYIRAHSAAGGKGARLVTPFANQDSSLVTIMAAANALIRRLPNAPAAPAGAAVEVLGPTL
ncbi:molybdopterin molybdotransferase MoeA [Brevundimonas sp. BT-123]|uniref:molybdopterin molybdotransferase MoeA n=1 Tax=Brevundimonas sp. BT-123 TaxID=2986928 RepID=UPI00223575E9|nr:gephyrin-like molybdotransferase Glp [Brevundimonas sp. BT-123]MCW0047491.1 molybdopterin molybdotransferase MoeA [Brevundimonas sp. BT-123]